MNKKKAILNYGLLLAIVAVLMPLITHAEELYDAEELIVIYSMWVIINTCVWHKSVFVAFAEHVLKEKNPGAVGFFFSVLHFIIIASLGAFTSFAVLAVDTILLVICANVMSSIKGKTSTDNYTLPSALAPQIVQTPTGKITCPKCGRIMAYGNTRCVVCGTDLRKASYCCTKCNTENLPTAKFCKSCGAEMIETTATAIGNATPSCPKCQAPLLENAKFCRECGENVEQIVAAIPKINHANDGIAFNPAIYEPTLMSVSIDDTIKTFVRKELAQNPDYKSMSLPSIERRKLITTGIYVVITFILISLYVFFHTYGLVDFLIWLFATYICISIVTKNNLEKHIIEEVKKRPDEKISNIVSSTLSAANKRKGLYTLARCSAVIGCALFILLLYGRPHLIYERQFGGYVVRYHTYGIFATDTDSILTVPEIHNGKKVIGIRGDTFKNERNLVSVILPDSITEIRGGAFEGCINLENIHLPASLTEIHGSTFKNCIKLKTIIIPNNVERIGGNSFQSAGLTQIEIPESVTEIGGEAFMGCTNLRYVKLPTRITEIHGSTFQDCSSLESIDIPEGVTRIGGSAFRNCTNLRSAQIPKTVLEFGSSAFRNTALRKVCISKLASVNERTFKETYATIYYHENNCKDSSSYNNYNSWSSSDYDY